MGKPGKWPWKHCNSGANHRLTSALLASCCNTWLTGRLSKANSACMAAWLSLDWLLRGSSGTKRQRLGMAMRSNWPCKLCLRFCTNAYLPCARSCCQASSLKAHTAANCCVSLCGNTHTCASVSHGWARKATSIASKDRRFSSSLTMRSSLPNNSKL